MIGGMQSYVIRWILLRSRNFRLKDNLTNPLQASAQARFFLLRVFNCGYTCQPSWGTMELCLLVGWCFV